MWSNNYAMQKQWIHIIHSSDLETPAYSNSETVEHVMSILPVHFQGFFTHNNSDSEK